MGGSALPGISRVELGMLISAQDDGFEGMVADSIEQINALRESWTSLSDLPSPFTGWQEQLATLTASAQEESQRIRELLSGLTAAPERLVITADTSAAQSALATLEANGKASLAAMEAAGASDLLTLSDDTAAAFKAMGADAAAFEGTATTAFGSVAAAMRNDMGDMAAAAQAAAATMQADIESAAQVAEYDLGAISPAAQAAFSAMGADAEAGANAAVSAVNDVTTAANAVAEKVQAAAQQMESALGGVGAEMETVGGNIISETQQIDAAFASIYQKLEAGAAQVQQQIDQDFAAAAQAMESSFKASAQSAIASIQEVEAAVEQLKAMEGGTGGTLSGTYAAPSLPTGVSASGAVAQALGSGTMTAAEAVAAGLITAEGAAALGYPVTEAATTPPAVGAETTGVAAAGSGPSVGNLMTYAGAAWMASMGVNMLANTGSGAVDLKELLQQNPGTTPQQMMQVLAEMGSVGVAPTAATDTIGQFEKSLRSNLTLVNSSGFSKQMLLAFQAAGEGGAVSQGENAQDMLSRLQTLGLQPQLDVLADLYQQMTKSGADMGDFQTLFGGLGASGPGFEALLSNYSQISNATKGVGAGLTTADVDQMASQSVGLNASLSSLNLSFMQLADDVAPAFTVAIEAATKALNQINNVASAGPVNATDVGLGAAGAAGLGKLLGGLGGATGEAGVAAAGGALSASALPLGLLALLPDVSNAVIGWAYNLFGGGGAGASGSGGSSAGLASQAQAMFLQDMINKYGASAMNGPPGQSFKVGNTPGNVTINVTLPAGADYNEKNYAQQVAQEIVTQLNLSGNFDLTG